MNVLRKLKMFSSIRFIMVCLLASVLFSCTKNSVDSDQILYNRSYEEAIAESQKVLNDFFFTSFIPGMSVSVSVDGEIVWSQGIGQASKELDVPAGRKTKYRIGTASELFTCYVLAMLQQQGVLNIDSSFYHYIPTFPEKEGNFTLRMLGAHTSGFEKQPINEIVRIDSIETFNDYVHTFKDSELSFIPNSYYESSVYNTALLAVVAETVSGKNYETLVTELVKDTLGLSSLRFDHPLVIFENRSDFYELDYIARLCNAEEVNLMPYAPVAGILLTADDLNRAACAMLSPGVFTAETIEMLTTPQVLNSGEELFRSFSWFLSSDRHDRKFLAQLGNISGGSSLVVVYPEQKVVVSIAANIDIENDELPAYHIAQIFLKHLEVE